MNSFGRLFRVSIFGESHGPLVGVTLDGVPAGIALDEKSFEKDLNRRKSGKRGTTPRKESDLPEIATGLFRGRTTGAPLTVLFRNENTLSGDYANLVAHPRPSHSDWVAARKFGGFNDYRGGGHFSGRLTLGLVAAGVVAKKILGRKVRIESRIVEIDDCNNPDDFPKIVEEALRAQDSVGGIVECSATGVPPALGEPFFDSVESTMSHLLFSIPAVKGVEFGAGFAAARMRGSEHNDPIISPDGTTATNNAGGIVGGLTMARGAVRTATNHAGGVNAGVTNGLDVVFDVTFRPTPSIAKEQRTVDLTTMTETTISVPGRHDACIALRAPVVVEAAAAVALCDLTLIARSLRP